MAHQDTPQDFDECIEACEEALHFSQQCAAADIREADPAMVKCALLCLDCADICATTLKAMARRSNHHGDFCALCAHICRACADECARHDHVHCKQCQAACEACAVACAKHASERHAS
ncbi:four-helix bundle copper-binding protein [Aquabacterium sp.]|uniref:four-helix bundle copper-binding protein n=1 Tax=Aquabacterium sp. TaxID=1872578 RepID=UPI00199C26C0|nr:four-helix bundle copper-binding protein [Aquabacterium sp.]MBC7700479.1 four-helix bundle copper-binding protein [Aquabacterium sp.]